MALQDAVSLETYVEALWITPAVVFSQLKYSWTEKIGENGKNSPSLLNSI